MTFKEWWKNGGYKLQVRADISLAIWQASRQQALEEAAEVAEELAEPFDEYKHISTAIRALKEK